MEREKKEPLDHAIKAYRIGATVKKLNPDEDIETICCMLGECATNLANGALKATGMIEKSEEILHSNYYKGKLWDVLPLQWTKLDASTEQALKTGLALLHQIEVRRAENTRGDKASAQEAKESLGFYQKVKETLLPVIF